MNKKIFIQIILLLISSLLITFVVKQYFIIEDNSMKIEPEKKDKSNEDQNILKNIKYKNTKDNGDIFEIFAKKGQINVKSTNEIFLTDVESLIKNNEGKILKITSKFADFNTETYETKFKEKVSIINEKEEKITGDELYLVYDNKDENLENKLNKPQNKAILSGNIKIENLKYQIIADVIEIDLITRNTKVYMLEKNKKISILNKN